MNTVEVLTLLLVIFAALSYIDNHNNKKISTPHYPKFECLIPLGYKITESKSESHPITSD